MNTDQMTPEEKLRETEPAPAREPEEVRETEPAQAAPQPEQPTPAQKLAAAIRDTTAQSHVLPLKKLKLHLPEGVTAEEAAAILLAAGTPEADPALGTIAFVQGKKDQYFYDSSIMTRHFAELDSLLMDKDILRTIAAVTRSDCKLYPRPTQFSKLMRYPFYFSEDEILGAAARMKDSQEYGDIGVVTASNGGKGFYSSQIISQTYAQALIELAEVGERANP